MGWKSELEARLRRQVDGYEERVPRRPDLEARILARAVSTPPLPARPTPLIRELAVAATFLLVAGAVGIGVIQLRAARQATEKPPAPVGLPKINYKPGLAVPSGPIDLGSARTGTTMNMFTPLQGWAVGPFAKGNAGVHDATLITADGGSHWRNVTPPGFSAEMDRIHFFLDASHAWVAIAPAPPMAGSPPTSVAITVFRTADGARTWQRGTLQVADGAPSGLDFIDALHGWMVLQNGRGIAIYGTVDGGAQWTFSSQQVPPQAPGVAPPPGTLPLGAPSPEGTNSQPDCALEPFVGIRFHDRSTGWAAGFCSGPDAKAYLYVSQDWGKTWQPQAIPPMPAAKCPCWVTTTAPAFTSAGSGSFSAALSTVESRCETRGTSRSCTSTPIPVRMYVYTTSDGGASWDLHPLPGASGGTPSLVDGRTGWHWATILKPTAIAPNDTAFDKLYVTHDGGVTWTPLPMPTPTFNGGDMQFINSTTGWVLSDVGSAQTLLKTTDGGQSWRQVTPTVD